MGIPSDVPEDKVSSRMKAMRALLLGYVSEEDLKMTVCRGIGGDTMVSALLKFTDSTLADRAHDVYRPMYVQSNYLGCRSWERCQRSGLSNGSATIKK